MRNELLVRMKELFAEAKLSEKKKGQLNDTMADIINEKLWPHVMDFRSELQNHAQLRMPNGLVVRVTPLEQGWFKFDFTVSICKEESFRCWDRCNGMNTWRKAHKQEINIGMLDDVEKINKKIKKCTNGFIKAHNIKRLV